MIGKRNKKDMENKIVKTNHYSHIDTDIILFFIYAFAGWLIEVVWCYMIDGTLANRGFLHIPILPIYGFGGIIVTKIIEKSKFNIWINIGVFTIIAIVLEYSTSFVLESIFHRRWWDYTGQLLNINGRICLLNSCLFVLFGYLLAKYISPRLYNKVQRIWKNKM